MGAVCTLPMFSLAGWPPTSLVWGDRGGPGPYREPPPPYLVPLHCLLYYWPPHMEPSQACLQHHHLHHRACIIIVVNLHSAFYPRNLQFHPGGNPVLKRVQLHRLSRIIWAQPYMKPANSFVIVDVMMIMCTTIFTVDVTTLIKKHIMSIWAVTA